MPPAMPASIISGRIHEPVMPQVNSATPVAATPPMIYWPSAPIFHTLARKAMERPTPMMISGAALTPRSCHL
ncbi:hypothetical protein D9M70_634950 [compost metagenome]